MKLLIILTVTLGTLVTGLDSVSFEISRVAGVGWGWWRWCHLERLLRW